MGFTTNVERVVFEILSLVHFKECAEPSEEHLNKEN
jgi:hypothetical protein